MMFRGDETSLGQFALSPDWEPARECAEFEALRRGSGSPGTTGCTSFVHPVWHEKLGEPYTSGFRVNVKSNGSPETSVNFPSAYFRSFATDASAQLIKNGELKEGDTFCYVVLAFPQTDEAENGSPPPFTVEAINSAVPMKTTRLQVILDHAERQGETATSQMPVFVPRRVLDEARELARTAGAKETGGILVGYLHRDDSIPEVFAEVTAQLPARHTKADLTKLTFTSETWTDVRAALGLRHRDEIMLGWWHSHPAREWCKDCSVESQRVCKMARDFFSVHDHALHRAIFPKAYSIALVVNDVGFAEPSFSLFGWKEGALSTRGFYVIEKCERQENVEADEVRHK